MLKKMMVAVAVAFSAHAVLAAENSKLFVPGLVTAYSKKLIHKDCSDLTTDEAQTLELDAYEQMQKKCNRACLAQNGRYIGDMTVGIYEKKTAKAVGCLGISFGIVDTIPRE